jgi:prolyl oligopeptidase
VKQFKSKSKDGTLVPYFVVSAKNAKNDGNSPTLLYAYGGFEVSQPPFYSATFGTAWLDNGGVFVLANIRGGGEFGPKWHQAGLKEKRQNIFDDFHSVAEDLIEKKITSSKHLGIMGGSNGGLLVGVAFTQRPGLYNAVVCQVPLLDMQRYNKLLAGASWMGEYGNPDIPEEWDYLKKYSPYHNLKKDVDYPEVFFYTSTRDDRVHPGHARKMVAKMNDMGYKTFYYENTEGGHAGSSTNEQSAKSAALAFSYLLMKLK